MRSVQTRFKLGLTQRVEMTTGRDWLALDEWTPFLEALREYCLQQGLPEIEWLALSNQPDAIMDQVERAELDGLILTGGNDLGECPWRDATEMKLLNWATTANKPVLGVCRGAQLMAYSCGALQQQCPGHAGTRHLVTFKDVWVAAYGKRREVNSYHHFGLPEGTFSPRLKPLAVAQNGDGTTFVEAFAHPDLPQLGILWHPERETPFHPMDLTLCQQLFFYKRID